MKKILVVEDNEMISSNLGYALKQEGYSPTCCLNAAAAYGAIETQRFDLAVLDVQLPDGTGFEVAERLKAGGAAIIFLTVVDDENKIVKALEEGAADYITKPFRLRELLARIKRTLNAADAEREDSLALGGASIDKASGKVLVREKEVELTALEYRLLLVFAENRGRLLSRSQILESIWDCGGNYVEDNTLTVYIKRLREKLGDAVKIETVRGLGYRAD